MSRRGVGADMVIEGKFWTAGLAGAEAGAIAVEDGGITAVERRPDAVEELVRSSQRVIRTGEGVVVPGFQDAHAHPIVAGLRMQTCDLHAFATARSVLDEIAAYARRHPDREWVVGAGWTFDAFDRSGPRREQLDEVLGARPAALVVRDEHALWANSEALRRANITERTPDPVGGRIERDSAGAPTGVLHESAMALLEDMKPHPSAQELADALRIAQATLHAHGVTAWQDALVGRFGDVIDTFDTYCDADRKGELTARVNAALFWDPRIGLEQIDVLADRRSRASGPRFAARTVKVMQDGIPENHTAAMHSPYLGANGRTSDVRGTSLLEPDRLAHLIEALQQADFDVHFHTMGDRALTEVLDALEAGRPGAIGRRHQIAHLQCVRPSDIPRFSELDVTADIQALWAQHGPQMDELCIPLLGPDRAEEQFPFADLIEAGARLAAGSDWPVSDPSPMKAIHVAVNRVAPEAPPGAPIFIERQRLTVRDALTAYTFGSSWVNRLDRSGRIAPGMLADLTLLDRDPFQIDPRDLHAVSPILTTVGGDEVWANGVG